MTPLPLHASTPLPLATIWIGKKVISQFAMRCPDAPKVLARWVPEQRYEQIACMAALYADATPMVRKFE